MQRKDAHKAVEIPQEKIRPKARGYLKFAEQDKRLLVSSFPLQNKTPRSNHVLLKIRGLVDL
jgi:hypothetical protein